MWNAQSVWQIQTTMPQTIMSRELLQMPAILLREYLSNSIIDNPFLELRDSAIDGPIYEMSSFSGKKETLYRDYVEHIEDPDASLSLAEELCGEQRDSLCENLKFQASLLDLSPKDRRNLNYLIELIDEDGYFREDIPEVSRELHISIETVLSLLKIIQQFYPTGVGARSLEECLVLQVDPYDPYAYVIRRIIEEDLLKVAQRHFTALERKYHLSGQQIQKIISKIQSLSPRPGLCFCTKTMTPYVYPEASITIEDSLLKIEMKNEPDKILVFNKSYMQDVEDAEARPYLRQKKAEAINLINSLDMRRTIIYQLLVYLTKEQRDFFFGGMAHLRPLTMKEAANALNVHPSTITRCVKDKYIETPWGILPLKCFFQKASGNEELSVEYVCQLIEKLISEERTMHPLSDKEISDRLKENGVSISRRTVSKYREQLNVPCQRKRRKY